MTYISRSRRCSTVNVKYVGTRIIEWFTWTSNVSAVREFLVSLLTISYQQPTTWPTYCVVQQSLVRSRILRCHGIPDASLQNVFQATVIAKLTYCATAWSGACSGAYWHWLLGAGYKSTCLPMFRCRLCQVRLVHQKKQATWLLQSETVVIHTATWWRRRQFLWSYHDEQRAHTSAIFAWATGNLLQLTRKIS